MVACLAALVGCARPLETGECDALLDRYTEHLLREGRPEISHIDVAKQQEAARRLAHETPRFEFTRCSELVSRRDFECAMTAVSVDAIERCLL